MYTAFLIELPANFNASTTEVANGFFTDTAVIWTMLFGVIAVGALIGAILNHFLSHK